MNKLESYRLNRVWICKRKRGKHDYEIQIQTELKSMYLGKYK